MKLIDKLAKIQKELKAPKNQKNNFGNYNYRSCEDIVEAAKPLLDGAILTISDDIVNLGARFYVKAIATIQEGEESISTTAFAREPETQKGMNEAQITGSTSSYARKYALNGLFAIDDTQDADSQDNSSEGSKKQPATPKKEGITFNKTDAKLIEQAIGLDPKNEFIQSIAKNYKQYGSLTEKQRESVSKMVEKEQEGIMQELDATVFVKD